jgi:hypothetical protein
LYTDPSGHEEITAEQWAAMAEQIYNLYGVWPQMGGIMLHDFLMGFNLYKTTGIDPWSSNWDPWNRGFEEYNEYQRLKPLYARLKNYDPNNDDPVYREQVIKDVINLFGINTNGANIHYDRSRNYSIGESDGKFIRENLYDLKAGDILIGKNAFKSLGWLGTTIGHELGHFTNWQNGWSYKEDSYRGEASIYKWQLKTQACFGLTSDEAQELQRRFDKNYSKYFQPGDEHRYDGIIPINAR